MKIMASNNQNAADPNEVLRLISHMYKWADTFSTIGYRLKDTLDIYKNAIKDGEYVTNADLESGEDWVDDWSMTARKGISINDLKQCVREISDFAVNTSEDADALVRGLNDILDSILNSGILS